MATITITVQSLLNAALYDSYTVDDTDTVGDLKLTIQTATDVDPAWYVLAFDNNVLDDGNTLASYSIVDGSSLRSGNIISNLDTLQDRQLAKLNLASLDRAYVDNPYSTYDIDLLPSQYIGNVSTPNFHPDGLVEGRPWTDGPPPPVTLVLNLDAAGYTSGPWVDTVSSLSFTLNNGVTYSSDGGGSLVFDPSSSQYADCSTSLSTLNTWTIEAWHYYDGTNTGSCPCIVSENYVGGSYVNYALGSISNSPYLAAGYFNNSWYSTPTGSYQLTSGNWYQVVGTFDGTTAKLYVNNTLVQTANASGGVPLGSNGPGIHLMARWDAPGISDYWGGKLAIVNMYDGDIGSSGVTSSWNTNKSRFGL